MNRRNFLGLSGMAFAAVLIQASSLRVATKTPAVAGANGILYRGTSRGDILASQDGGSTWSLHSRFGEQYAITGMSSKPNGQVFADVDFMGGTFQLALGKNGKFWGTV